MKKKDLIINLIKDELVHTKLLDGFSGIGFDMSEYHLNLNEAVFFIAGFRSSQITSELKEWYFRKIEDAMNLSFPPRLSEELEELASSIYLELMAELQLRKTMPN